MHNSSGGEDGEIYYKGRKQENTENRIAYYLLIVTFILSAGSSYQAVKSYELWDRNGVW